MSTDARAASGGEAGSCGCSEPAEEAAETCYCTVDHLVGVISRKHALSIVNFVGKRGTARFSEVEAGLGDLSSSTLSETLQELADVGLVHRRVVPESPPRVEYSLTDAGRTLRQRFRALLDRLRTESGAALAEDEADPGDGGDGRGN